MLLLKALHKMQENIISATCNFRMRREGCGTLILETNQRHWYYVKSSLQHSFVDANHITMIIHKLVKLSWVNAWMGDHVWNAKVPILFSFDNGQYQQVEF